MDKIALAANLAGTVGQTVAGVQSTSAAQGAYGAQAKSEIAAGEYNARQEEIAGEFNLARQRDINKRQLGKGRAILGASNLVTSSGTPLDIMLESAKQAELEALAIQSNTASRAGSIRYNAGLRGQAATSRGQIAGMERLPLIGQGAVRGSTYLSDWFNNYGLMAKKKKAGDMYALDKELTS